MPSKRPSPLSEDALNNAKPGGGAAPAAVPVFAPANGATWLGETNNGMPLPVKNTFIDVPSGFTPSNMRSAKYQPLMTAPPDLNINAGAGFMQRAMAASAVSGVATTAAVAAAGMIPTSPLATGGTISGGVGTRRISQTPLATPSPSAAFGFSQWVAAAGSTAPARPAAPYALPGVIGGLPAAQAPATQFQDVSRGAFYSFEAFSPKAGHIRTSIPDGFGQPVVKPDEEDDEDDDDDEEVAPHLRNLADAPQPPPGALHPSLGSDGHEEGTCKRCCFFPRGRCTNGYDCEFCHYDHEKRKRKNKKKKKKDASAMPAGTAVMYQPQAVQALPPQMQQLPPQAVQALPPQMQQLPPQACAQPQQLYAAYPPSPDRASQQQPPMVLGTQGFAPQQAPQHHHVIYGPTHGHSQAGSPGGNQGVVPLQAFMGNQAQAQPMPQQMPPQQMPPQQLPPQQLPPQQLLPQQLPPQMLPQQMPPQHNSPSNYMQQQPAFPPQMPPPQGYAPPMFQPPAMMSVGEPTPPPPMLSPKLGQATLQGAMMPPPASSPKFSRPMMPAVPATMQPVDGPSAAQQGGYSIW